jgi:hypothetical protein
MHAIGFGIKVSMPKSKDILPLIHLYISIHIIHLRLRLWGYTKTLEYVQLHKRQTWPFVELVYIIKKLIRHNLCPSSCLTQALSLVWLCHQTDPIFLCIGVSGTKSTHPLDAHAWIESPDKNILWGQREQTFQLIYRWPE